MYNNSVTFLDECYDPVWDSFKKKAKADYSNFY